MVMNGRKIAESAFLDVENFFYHSAKFRVKKEYDQNRIKSHATCSGSADSMRIRLSQDFCAFEANSISDYLFILTILSHELAHYLNNHNSYKDKEHLDSIAIEARADHFGAQIFMTLLTFGKNTQRNLRAYELDMTQTALFEAIGEALNDAYEKLFKHAESRRYPDPENRVMLLIAGCLSFFNRYFSPLPEKFTVAFLTAVIRKASFVHNTDGEMQLTNGENIGIRIDEIHKKIESQAGFYLDGVKYFYGYFLSANFDQTIEDRKAHKAKLDKMIGSWSIMNGD